MTFECRNVELLIRKRPENFCNDFVYFVNYPYEAKLCNE